MPPPEPTAPRARVRAIPWTALLVVLVPLAVHARVVGHDFVLWDDPFHVLENPHLRPPSWSGLAHLWSEPHGSLYVPVAYTLFALEAWLSGLLGGGPEPALFHATSVALHALCAWLVLRLLTRLGLPPPAAACGALLFALHPLQVESVAWISEQRGLASAALGLAALAALLDGARAERPARALAIATLAAALALLAKPSAVALPLQGGVLLLLAARVGPAPRAAGRAAAAVALWLALALAVVLWTKVQQPDEAMTRLSALADRPRIAADALAFYLGKLVAPIGLGPDYARTPERVLAAEWTRAAWVAPLTLAFLGALPRGRAWWLAALALFVVALLPVLGLVPFRYQEFSTVADRYAYLALLGPALALARGLDLLEGRGHARAGRIGAAVLLAACAALSVRQAGFWRDTRTLFERGLAVQPDSITSHNNLGVVEYQEGRLDEALEHYARVLALAPNGTEAPRAHNNVALILERYGRPAEALPHYLRALAMVPDFPEARRNLAAHLARADAEGGDRAALEHLHLGLGYRALDDPDDARRHLERALELDPGLEPARRALDELGGRGP